MDGAHHLDSLVDGVRTGGCSEGEAGGRNVERRGRRKEESTAEFLRDPFSFCSPKGFARVECLVSLALWCNDPGAMRGDARHIRPGIISIGGIPVAAHGLRCADPKLIADLGAGFVNASPRQRQHAFATQPEWADPQRNQALDEVHHA